MQVAITTAEIVDIRRFCGYAPTAQQSVTAAQLANAINAAWNETRYPLTTAQVEAVIANLQEQNLAIVNDPASLALANMSSDLLLVVRTYLANMRLMETDLFGVDGVRQTLDTAKADVWTRNPDEYKERSKLYRDARISLCRIIALEVGPLLYINLPAGFVVN